MSKFVFDETNSCFRPDAVVIRFTPANGSNNQKAEEQKLLSDLQIRVNNDLQSRPEHDRYLRIKAERDKCAAELQSVTNKLADLDTQHKALFVTGAPANERIAAKDKIKQLSAERDGLLDDLAMFDSCLTASEQDRTRIAREQLQSLTEAEMKKYRKLYDETLARLAKELSGNEDILTLVDAMRRLMILDPAIGQEGRYILSRPTSVRRLVS